MIKRMLPEGATVCAAFNNIAANKWKVLDYSVAVCCGDDGAKQQIMEFVNAISNLRAYDAGPLAAASVVERRDASSPRHRPFQQTAGCRREICVKSRYFPVFVRKNTRSLSTRGMGGGACTGGGLCRRAGCPPSHAHSHKGVRLIWRICSGDVTIRLHLFSGYRTASSRAID